MEKHNKKRASLRQYPVLLAFGLFFLGLFVLDLVTPDRAYSELENTTLAQRPKLTAPTADGLNNYFTGYTKYVKDQVFGRDEWISLQGFVETALFQKTENGGILLGKEHQMFPRTYSLLSSETRALPKNTAALESLCQRYPGKVNVMLVPAASAIYPENVPAGAPLLDEDGYLDSLSDAVQAAGGRFVDVRQTLTDHKDEYIYYRTDHHWTSTGAYYAYKLLCDTLGLTPFDPSAHTVLAADGFYGTHYSKARTPDAEPDTITYYDLPNELTIYSVSGPGQPAEGETTETAPAAVPAATATASAVVSSPLQGKAIALEEVKDEVFSQKILGDGIAVVPEKGELYAPADGVIESVFGTKHAISMKTNAGAELLMHIGMDTVKRDGKGFDPQVKDGETVKKGQLLMKFDLDGIKADGYDVTTPIVVTNADEFTIKTVAEGAVVPGAALLKLEANK